MWRIESRGDGGEATIMILAVLICILLICGSTGESIGEPWKYGKIVEEKPYCRFYRKVLSILWKGGKRMSMKSWRRAGLIGLIIVLLPFAPVVFGQEKPKAEEKGKETNVLAITRLAVGTGVENRELQGATEKFPLDTEKVYCFLEAANIPNDMEITILWSNGGKEVGKLSLPLKQGPKWRTWAFKNLRGLKGEWKVEVTDPKGKVLKEARFKVE